MLNINNTQCPELLAWLIDHIQPGSLVLDIGCGNKWYWPFLQAKGIQLLGVDAWEKFKPHLTMDLAKDPWPFAEDVFDVVLLLDVLEHMSKEDGLRLLSNAYATSKKACIVLTPLEWSTNEEAFHHGEYKDNPHVIHQSLWTVEDFPGFTRVHPDSAFGAKYFWGYK